MEGAEREREGGWMGREGWERKRRTSSRKSAEKQLALTRSAVSRLHALPYPGESTYSLGYRLSAVGDGQGRGEGVRGAGREGTERGES